MRRRRRLTYLAVTLLVVAITFAGGWMLRSPLQQPQTESTDDPDARQLVDELFNQGVNSMLNRQYSRAVETWTRLLLINDSMPEAHVNMGFSLFELNRHDQACAHFQRAMDLNAYQANAYYGFAICAEQLGDIPAALGAMRSYVHLADQDDPHLRKARAAIWEWESREQNSEPAPASNLPDATG